MATHTQTVTHTKVEVEVQLEEEGQTIVHCLVRTSGLLRIWRSTFLIDNLGNRHKLLHAENIAIFPYWGLPVGPPGKAYFTLVFEKLPSDISHFIVEEQIPEPGGFYSNPIPRNNSGVYNTELFCK